jgi:hypothetical protein
MAKMHKNFEMKTASYKKTSQSKRKRSVKFGSMNKHKKRNWKMYNGQGK